MNAECIDTERAKEVTKGNIWPIHRCACKAGFVGNGIVCANETTGKHHALPDSSDIITNRNTGLL